MVHFQVQIKLKQVHKIICGARRSKIAATLVVTFYFSETRDEWSTYAYGMRFIHQKVQHAE